MARKKVLFVCLGNICRSPAAEGILRHLIIERGLQDVIQCESAGTAAYHVGKTRDSRMIAAGKSKGILIDGTARQFEEEDFHKYDLILAADRSNYRNIMRLDPKGQHAEKVKMICDFCSVKYPDKEVPDPYYELNFDYVVDLLLDACTGVLDHLVVASNHPMS